MKPLSNFISTLLFCNANTILAEDELFFFLVQPSVSPFPLLSGSARACVPAHANLSPGVGADISQVQLCQALCSKAEVDLECESSTGQNPRVAP